MDRQREEGEQFVVNEKSLMREFYKTEWNPDQEVKQTDQQLIN